MNLNTMSRFVSSVSPLCEAWNGPEVVFMKANFLFFSYLPVQARIFCEVFPVFLPPGAIN